MEDKEFGFLKLICLMSSRFAVAFLMPVRKLLIPKRTPVLATPSIITITAPRADSSATDSVSQIMTTATPAETVLIIVCFSRMIKLSKQI